MSKRLLLTAALTAVVASAQGPFDKKLSGDQRILQALNRLTFGARPGDVEEVKRIGLEKWMGMQLRPESVPESDLLAAKLKPLETLRLDTPAVLKDYQPVIYRGVQQGSPFDIISREEYQKLQFGTLEERMAVLKPLDETKRRRLLGMLPPQSFTVYPELKKEADAARAANQAEQQKEFRKMMPQLSDLLNPDQMNMIYRANTDQIKDLFEYLDPEKRAMVASAMPPQTLAAFPELRRMGMKMRQPQQLLVNDLREGKIFRAAYSNRQLEEVLTDFWFNHFNVWEGKQGVRPLMTSYERDAIRPHVLGHFKDLLVATARHPAMLYYLDNWESMGSDVFSIGPFAEPVESIVRNVSRRAHGINENYGRELMELHTLGVKGGYTQEDVIAVARCFTGWTIGKPDTKAEFVFAAFMHDAGEKTVLGHKIAAGGGEQDGLQVMDILAHHASTAKFISRKLAVRFVSDDPPQSLVDRMAQTFTKTDGDLREVMQTMFNSPEFLSEGAWQAKIKSPLEMVVSAVRSAGGDVTDPAMLVQKIADLGEPLYGKQEPTGYSNTGEGWLNTANLFGRINFAAALTSGQIQGAKIDAARLDGKDPAWISHEILGAEESQQTRDAIAKAFEGKQPTPRFIEGLILGSPDFQKR